MGSKRVVLALFWPLALAVPFEASKPVQKRVTINTQITPLGFTESDEPNIYRDGGGGGTINGLNFMWFADGIYTSDGNYPKEDLSNWANFTSNSIAAAGYQGTPITHLTEFGDNSKGPRQQVPYYYNNGENDGITGIWPNNNWVTLCGGSCAVSFPQVVNRTAYSQGLGSGASLYNTPVQIQLTAFGPVVTRPAQSLFKIGEPLYGAFSSFLGIDGYLYSLAKVTETKTSNGLKLARVPSGAYADRSQYQYWNGNAFTNTMPAYDDGGAANIIKWSKQYFPNSGPYGPGSGDIFWSSVYNVYILLFQSDSSAVDNNVYLTYSSELTGGWSEPVSIYQTPTFSDGYDYGFHAYPSFDPSSRVIPISWTQYSTSITYRIGMANITFS